MQSATNNPTPTIDLNADLGESQGQAGLDHDMRLLELISSANLACGFHAGEPLWLRRLCKSATDRGVCIGAQVSYPDREGFGRRDMDLPADELCAIVLYQLGALSALSPIAYLKPHGALYNRVVWDAAQAAAVVEAARLFNPGLPLLCLPNSQLLKQAQASGLPVITEGFADRAYTADGRLQPRSEPGAVITDADSAAQQALQLASSGDVRSICVHSDTPNAVAVLAAVRASLMAAGFTLRPFA